MAKKLALLAVLLASGCGTSVERMSIPLSPATTPTARPDNWWQTRNDSFNRIAARGDVEVVFLGDSITQNWDRAGREVWQEHYGQRKAANFGINSDSTRHVLYRVENGNFDGISPKVVVLMIGTNNQTPPQQTAEGVMAIVQALRQKAQRAKVLLLAIFPRGRDNSDANRRENVLVSRTFSKIADNRHVFYMDIGSAFLDADGTLSRDISRDHVHLTADGYRRWAEAIEPELKRLLGEE
jgi:lysophospholipase L1-like esterase